MILTKALKTWLVENCDVKADANDDEFKTVAGTAIATGDLPVEKYSELITDPKAAEASEFQKKQEAIEAGVKKLLEEKEKDEIKDEIKDETPKTKDQPSAMAKMIARMGGTPLDHDEKDIDYRVKEAAEQYDTTKTALVYPGHTKGGGFHVKAGQRVMTVSEKGSETPMDEPSQQEKAVNGAWGKFMVETLRKNGSRTLAFQALPQHDKELILWGMDNLKWSCSDDVKVDSRNLIQSEKQALIDDAASGGFEAVPIVFDDDVISAPLLTGELFPMVNTRTIPRGRLIEGVATENVTLTWGGVDAAAIPLFNTANYVTAFDTTIYRVEGAIHIGRDFLSDTPIDFNAHITAQYGERLLQELDDVIATGNGATQPLGVMNTAAITTVAWGGATTLGNYEALRFAVTKPEHSPAMLKSAVFCGTETSYLRAKAIPVAAADARRVFAFVTTTAGTFDDYAIMQRAYKINESLANTEVFYAILGRYRMYRRRGLTMRSSIEGDTLIRDNELLITMTARFGGQMERAAAAAVTTTAPA